MRHSKELILDGYRFLGVEDILPEDPKYLFRPGEIYVCEGVISDFSEESLRDHLTAHLKREVGEFNMGLLNSYEKEYIEEVLGRMLAPSASENPFREALELHLPQEIQGFVFSELESENPDLILLRREIFRSGDSSKFSHLLGLLENYLNAKNAAPETADPWEFLIKEEKEFDDIENESVIDSLFSDGMVIMTTAERKSTIIYQESNVKRIYEFYSLDQRL